MINITSTYTLVRDVLFQELEGEMVLLASSSALYFSLNRTGTDVLRLLNNHMTVEEVCKRLAKEYDVSQEKLVTDTIEFLKDLIEAGLVKADI